MLTDLDGDGLPELIALGEGHEGLFGIEAVSFVLDFNGDGAVDFVMTPTASDSLRPNQPLIC